MRRVVPEAILADDAAHLVRVRVRVRVRVNVRVRVRVRARLSARVRAMVRLGCTVKVWVWLAISGATCRTGCTAPLP